MRPYNAFNNRHDHIACRYGCCIMRKAAKRPANKRRMRKAARREGQSFAQEAGS